MKKCKEWVYDISSGKADEAKVLEKMKMKLHLMMCQKCKNFKFNNDILKSAMKNYRDDLTK